jgi:serine/threonine-protein kinase HipA
MMRLAVHIHETLAGHILVAGNHDGIEFRPAESYANAYPRHVLGQVFEDDPAAVHRSRVRLPPFFSNLLPEGTLRDLLAKKLGIHTEREPWLMAQLGEDLPGAVRVTIEEPDEESFAVGDETHADGDDGPLKFSLAGVQLKFSAIRHDRGLTIPVHGVGGDQIVKLPDARHPRVPENEWSMMTWAREAKLDVAYVELVNVGDIAGLPTEVGEWTEDYALVVRRFDRDGSRRIHIEDFAQILNVYSEGKYKHANYETLGKIIFRAVGEVALREYVRRLVFIVAIGNGDAHLKNWSLIYRDGFHPELSPAYDLVSTIQYMSKDGLGLNLAKSKDFANVTPESLFRFATKIGVSQDLVRDELEKSIFDIRAAWKNIRDSLPLPPAHVQQLEEHWQSVPLLSGATSNS